MLPLILLLISSGSLALAASNPADQFSSFKVRFDVLLDRQTGKEGNFTVEVFPHWAPNGVERFKKIIEDKAWDNSAFFRYMEGSLIQWRVHQSHADLTVACSLSVPPRTSSRGIPADPKVTSWYRTRSISDDTPRWSNLYGTLSFGANGKNSRSIQVFANIADNHAAFDTYHGYGFPPFAKVVEGMDVLLSVYKGYKEKPDMWTIEHEGNKYLEREFPKLSYIKTLTILGQKAKEEL